ncbi:MAG: glycosyltransferase family 4 protein, partial [Bacteroidetes bacterium]|nr:glycosyltransferase family 4 protein [Bacteroidota bacterium]
NVIKLLPELIKIYPEIHYHCVGIPTQKEEFISIALKLKVETHITFHGKVSDSHLQDLLQSSDVFVMLSSPTQTGDVEGFGIAIIEANALGLPSIGAEGCGIEDAISNKKSGILVTYNDSEVFLKALNEILSKYENYKFEAKQWAKQHTWETIIKLYIKEINL